MRGVLFPSGARCHRHLTVVFVAASCATIIAGCGGGSPTGPTATDTLAGRWVGDATDSSGPGRLALTLEQRETTVTGQVTIIDSTAGIVGRGSLTGTLAASLFTFTIEIPAGGFDAPYTGCTARLTGTGQVGAGARDIAATYSGTNSCTGAVSAGSVTLQRP